MLLCVDKRVRRGRRGSSLAKAAISSSSRSFCLTESDLLPWLAGAEDQGQTHGAVLRSAGQAPVRQSHCDLQKLRFDLSKYNFPPHMCKAFYPLVSSWLFGDFFPFKNKNLPKLQLITHKYFASEIHAMSPQRLAQSWTCRDSVAPSASD